MNVLLDECLPARLGRLLTGHSVTTVPRCGWAGIKNGVLLKLAEKEYDVFGPNDPLRVPEYCLDSPSRTSLRSTNWRHKRRPRPVRWALPAST